MKQARFQIGEMFKQATVGEEQQAEHERDEQDLSASA
jgi:hypothetical protein